MHVLVYTAPRQVKIEERPQVVPAVGETTSSSDSARWSHRSA